MQASCFAIWTLNIGSMRPMEVLRERRGFMDKSRRFNLTCSIRSWNHCQLMWRFNFFGVWAPFGWTIFQGCTNSSPWTFLPVPCWSYKIETQKTVVCTLQRQTFISGKIFSSTHTKHSPEAWTFSHLWVQYWSSCSFSYWCNHEVFIFWPGEKTWPRTSNQQCTAYSRLQSAWFIRIYLWTFCSLHTLTQTEQSFILRRLRPCWDRSTWNWEISTVHHNCGYIQNYRLSLISSINYSMPFFYSFDYILGF